MFVTYFRHKQRPNHKNVEHLTEYCWFRHRLLPHECGNKKYLKHCKEKYETKVISHLCSCISFQYFRLQTQPWSLYNKVQIYVSITSRQTYIIYLIPLKINYTPHLFSKFALRGTLLLNSQNYNHASTRIHHNTILYQIAVTQSRSQWPCGLRRGSAAASLLELWVRIPPRLWMSVCCVLCAVR
jgi:hypothetical protein